jgi:NAD-dependent deacetylase
MSEKSALGPSAFLASRLSLGGVVFFTGAGLSTASGLPDFRSAERGLWGKVDPMRLATVNAMRSNYDEFRTFYQSRIDTLRTAAPNRAHYLIAEWEQKKFVSGVITQNTDGFHQKASIVTISALHGNLALIRCADCSEEAAVDDFMDNRTCRCGGHLRPSVVLFGEDLPRDALQLARRLIEECKTCVVLGSSLTVTPANQFPIIAHSLRKTLVIVNQESTEFDSLAQLIVRDPIVDYLEDVEKELTKLTSIPYVVVLIISL